MSGLPANQGMRSDYWDACKGVAIFAVVAIHAVGSGLSPPKTSFGFRLSLGFEEILNFAVPLFFAISGYFVRLGKPGSFSEIFSFWSSRFLRILPPYLFWTGVSMLLYHPGHFLEAKAAFTDVALGMGLGIGYFVIVLVQLLLLAPCSLL